VIDLRQEGDGYCHPHESISTPDEQQSPAWIARVVCQPVRNVEMRSDGIDIWRRFDTLLMSNDLDQRHRIRRVPARRGQWSPPQSWLDPFFSTILGSQIVRGE